MRKCWSPAVVLSREPTLGRAESELTTVVRFYDCSVHTLGSATPIIPIDQSRFEEYTQSRFNKELAMINRAIVGFNATEKSFMLGTVLRREPLGHEYFIRWRDGTESIQDEQHIFTPPDRCYRDQVNNYVLVVDMTGWGCRPAKIIALSDDRTTVTIGYLDSGQTDRYAA